MSDKEKDLLKLVIQFIIESSFPDEFDDLLKMKWEAEEILREQFISYIRKWGKIID